MVTSFLNSQYQQTFKANNAVNIKAFFFLLNPLTARGDQHATSPKNIGTLSRQQVMRILKIIR